MIKEKTGLGSELIKGSGGIFDVFLDETLLFSKHRVNRFPDHEEILEQLP